MAPGLLLLLLWLQACIAGPPALSAYRRLQLQEGQTLSLQCSYRSRRNHVEGKVWCKIRKRKCEASFPRPWVMGPSYRMQDDVQARVVTITMVDLRQEDSGRYWCMRETSGALFPLEGFLLEVSPGPATERSAPLTHRADDGLRRGAVITTGRVPTSGPDAPFTSGVAAFTPGPLTWAGLRPSAALGIRRPTSVTGSSLSGIVTTMGPWRTGEPQLVTASPSAAYGPVSIATRPSGSSPTSGTCCDQLSPTRYLLDNVAPGVDLKEEP